MKEFTRIYIVRHAETTWNVEGICLGHKDSPLTELGKQQAKELGNRFKDVKFDAVYSSDLLRCIRTAEIIIENRGIDIRTTPDLRERSWGIFEGQRNSESEIKYKNLFDKFEKLNSEERFTSAVHESVESDKHLAHRFIKVLEGLAREHTNKNILVVAHGSMIQILLEYLDKAQAYWVTNTGYIILKCDGVNLEVEKIDGINVSAKVDSKVIL